MLFQQFFQENRQMKQSSLARDVFLVLLGAFFGFAGIVYQTHRQPELEIEARENYEKNIQKRDKKIVLLEQRVQQLENSDAEKDAKIAELDERVIERDNKIAQLTTQVSNLQAFQDKFADYKMKADGREYKFIETDPFVKGGDKGEGYGIEAFKTTDGKIAVYAGQFRKGKKTGYGIWFNPDGRIWMGKIQDSSFNGPGIRINQKGIFCGQLKKDYPFQTGIYKSPKSEIWLLTTWKNETENEKLRLNLIPSGNSLFLTQQDNKFNRPYHVYVGNEVIGLCVKKTEQKSDLLVANKKKVVFKKDQIFQSKNHKVGRKKHDDDDEL